MLRFFTRVCNIFVNFIKQSLRMRIVNDCHEYNKNVYEMKLLIYALINFEKLNEQCKMMRLKVVTIVTIVTQS